MSNYDPVKCPDCSVWWRGETHKCLLTVTAALVQPVIQEQLAITQSKKRGKHKPTPKAGKKWSKDEDEIMLQLLDKGISATVVGKMLGRTGAGVRRRKCVLTGGRINE